MRKILAFALVLLLTPALAHAGWYFELTGRNMACPFPFVQCQEMPHYGNSIQNTTDIRPSTMGPYPDEATCNQRWVYYQNHGQWAEPCYFIAPSQ